MKKLFLSFCITLAATASYAQLAIKLTPMTLPRNMKFTGHVEYLIPGTPNVSVAIGVSPNLFPKSSGLEDQAGGLYYDIDMDNSKAGFSIDPEVRYYFNKPMEGMYGGFYSSQRFSSATLNEYQDYLLDPADSTYYYANPTGGTQGLKTHVGVYGFQLGYQKWLGQDDRIIFDFYVGGGTAITTRTYDMGENLGGPGFETEITQRIALRGNVSIGVLLFKGHDE